MIRSTIFILFQTVSVSIWGILVLLFAPFMNISQRYTFTMIWPKMNIFLAKFLLEIDYELEGYKNLEAHNDSPVIICSNHQSAWETFFFANGLLKNICFVFKKELLLIPFFGWGIGLLKMIHIDRKAGKKALDQIIHQTPKQIALNRWIVFFPEGTRAKPGETLKYKIGAAVLSNHFGIPIIPIAHNSGKYWKKNAWIKKKGMISLKIGPAVNPKNKSPEQIISEVRDWIQSNTKT